ncbi:DUF1405 domain-containing protein [Fictibacillus iocasae]|uniref:DUF1405 domain-containing protein n=1 Tax=Fictibacillus iocasae TaxID=2715437 RepID=A0ABW2NMK2_9BACL
MAYLRIILMNKLFLVLMLIINIAGTIYGYIWYEYQMKDTPVQFLLFVPDSPTASLFFIFVLLGFLIGKNSGLFQALAAVSLFKYGIWAVGMNVGGSFAGEPLDWINYMLIISHLGMAAEGLLYAPFYRIKAVHLMIAMVILLHNDIIDYVFGMMPRYPALQGYSQQIGYFTFWLSLLSVFIVWILTASKRRITQ